MLHVILLIYSIFLGEFTVLTQHFDLAHQFSDLQYADPDSAGYRKCAYWELSDGTHIHSDCTPHTMERCGQTASFTYKCCSGFKELSQPYLGFDDKHISTCGQMISPFDSCIKTVLNTIHHSAFAPELAGVQQLKNDHSAYTIFAPKVGSVHDVPDATEYVVKGRFYAADLKDGMGLETLDGKHKFYVSRFPYGAIAVDCVELLDADLECSNGLIHKIKQVVNKDATGVDRRSLINLLRTHPDLKSFLADLPADLQKELGNVASGKRYTILAPRSQTWDELKGKYDTEMLQKIAASHVLPNQICSGGLITSTNEKRSIHGDRLRIKCKVDAHDPNLPQEKRTISTECGEEHELIQTDLTASNGVVHVLDKPLIPLSAMSFKDLMENEKCAEELKVKKFIDVLKECDLYMEDGVEYSIVLPQDASFIWWSSYAQFQSEYQRFQVDKDYRCRVARYHIVRSGNRLKSMKDFSSHTLGHRTNNRNDMLYETTYFVKTPYGSQLNFHYSTITDMQSRELDGTSLFIANRINVPPEKNITDILRERSDIKLANNQTAQADMDVKYFMKHAPRNLYLVTTDDGWKDPRAKPTSVNPYRPELNMYKGESLEKFLLLHHVPLYLWGGDIGYFQPNSVHKFMSSAGVELIFWRDAGGVMRIGHDQMQRDEWPKVVQWNLPARDGIMWLLDGSLKCPDTVCKIYLEDIDYYDMVLAACQTPHLPGELNAAIDFRNRPKEVANRHLDVCTVVTQLSERSVNLIEAK